MIRDLEVLINWMLKGIEYLPEISFINYLHWLTKNAKIKWKKTSAFIIIIFCADQFLLKHEFSLLSNLGL